MSTTPPRAGMPNDDHAGVSSARLRAARAAKGWTQKQLAEDVQVTRNTITTLERGGSVRPSTRLAVARALGIADDDDVGPSLRGATDAELLGEVARRMSRRG